MSNIPVRLSIIGLPHAESLSRGGSPGLLQESLRDRDRLDAHMAQVLVSGASVALSELAAWSFVRALVPPQALAMALMLCVWAALPAVSAPNANLLRSYTGQVKQLRQAIAEADNLLWSQMQRTASLLEKFYRQAGHLPEAGREQEAFRALILSKAPLNPYHPKVIINGSKPFEKPLDVQFVTDGSLSETLIRQASLKPPDSWHAEPGTISVITNGNSLFLIWGASADQYPMRSFVTEKPKYIVRDFSGELLEKSQLSE